AANRARVPASRRRARAGCPDVRYFALGNDARYAMAVGSRTSELGARRARAKISRATLALALGVIALVAMMAIALSAGQYPITIGDLTALLWARASGEAPVGVSPMVETIVLDVRAPRVLAALLVGAA